MKSHAFTLVELLIVVGIIGLLATIGVSAYKSAAINGRNSQRKANLTQMGKALEMYANDHGGLYPSTAGSWYGEPSTRGSHTTSGASGYIPNLAPAYMPVLPHDVYTSLNNPNSTNSNCQASASFVASYIYRSDGTNYKISAFCLLEGPTPATSDPFYDTARPDCGYQISSPGGSAW